MKKLVIITTHPIQYNAPLFRLLSERKRISVKVIYTWEQSKNHVYDAQFGLQRSWDIPLLEGYEYEFVKNISLTPDSNKFWGVINPGLYRKIKKEKFDAVLVYRWSLWSHFFLLQCLGKKQRLFFRGDSHLLQKGKGFKQFLKDHFLRLVYRNVTKAFVVGTHNRHYMHFYGLANNQLVYAPNVVDNKRFRNNSNELEAMALKEREALGISNDTVVFLYAGKFYELKHLDLLINAFKLLKGEHYRLLLTGNGKQEQWLRDIAENDKRILFQSFRNQTEMPLLYRIGDVFVLPSKSETWGLGVNEAMACGRAAIVSDQCGCAPDLIVQDKNGYVFKSNDQESLLQCLSKVTTKAKAKQMGEHALSFINQFSLEKVAEAIEETVNDY